jgi:choline-glycine betaine transporter
MSLKAFHIFFIATSVLLAVGLGIMTLRTFLQHHAVTQLGWSLLSFAAALALIFYGARILKKLQNVGFL